MLSVLEGSGLEKVPVMPRPMSADMVALQVWAMAMAVCGE